MKTTPEKLEELKAMAEHARSHFCIELAEAFVSSVPDLIADLENERARGIHSCNDNCTRNGCVNVRIRKELAEAVTLYNDTLRKLSAEYAEAKRQWKLGYAEGNREVQHWRANHESVVKKLRLFTQREDLPVDRLPAYEYVMELEKKLAEAQALVSQYRNALLDGPENTTLYVTEQLESMCESAALDTAIAEAIEPYRKDAERFQELLSRVGDDSGPTIVKIEGRSDEYPGYAWFADLSQEQVIAELDAAIAAKGDPNEQP